MWWRAAAWLGASWQGSRRETMPQSFSMSMASTGSSLHFADHDNSCEGLPSPFLPAIPPKDHRDNALVRQSIPWIGSCCSSEGHVLEWIGTQTLEHSDLKCASSQTWGRGSKSESACRRCDPTCCWVQLKPIESVSPNRSRQELHDKMIRNQQMRLCFCASRCAWRCPHSPALCLVEGRMAQWRSADYKVPWARLSNWMVLVTLDIWPGHREGTQSCLRS